MIVPSALLCLKGIYDGKAPQSARLEPVRRPLCAKPVARKRPHNEEVFARPLAPINQLFEVGDRAVDLPGQLSTTRTPDSGRTTPAQPVTMNSR